MVVDGGCCPVHVTVYVSTELISDASSSMFVWQLFFQELLVAAAEWGRKHEQQRRGQLQAQQGNSGFEGTTIESLGLKSLLLLHYALPSPSHPNGQKQRAPLSPTTTTAAAGQPRAFPTGRPLPSAEAAAALGGPGRCA